MQGDLKDFLNTVTLQLNQLRLRAIYVTLGTGAAWSLLLGVAVSRWWLFGGVLIFIAGTTLTLAAIKRSGLFLSRNAAVVAADLDTRFGLKERGKSFLELISYQETESERIQLIEKQISLLLGTTTPEDLAPLALKRREKYALLSAVSALILTVLLLFTPPAKTAQELYAEKIERVLAEQGALPQPLQQELAALAERLREHDLNSDEVEEALSRSESELSEASKDAAQGNDMQPEDQPAVQSSPEQDQDSAAQSQEEGGGEQNQEAAAEGEQQDDNKEPSQTGGAESREEEGTQQGDNSGETERGEGDGPGQGGGVGESKDENQQQGGGANGEGSTPPEAQDAGEQKDNEGQQQPDTQEQGSGSGDDQQAGAAATQQQALAEVGETLEELRSEIEHQKQEAKEPGPKEQQPGGEERGSPGETLPPGEQEKETESEEQSPSEAEEQGPSQASRDEQQGGDREQDRKQAQNEQDADQATLSDVQQQERQEGDGTNKDPFGSKKAYREAEIAPEQERYDRRYTGAGRQVQNPKEAQPKTTLEDLELAKPEPLDDQAAQPIPLEYRDMM